MLGVQAVLIAVVLSGPAQQTPVQELGNLMVGRWIGDVTLVADWPGIGKRGEKVVAYMSAEWIADGQGFELEWFGGTGVGKEIYVWDAQAKVVRSMAATSGGGMIHRTWTKQDNHWIVTPHGALADGTPVRGQFIVTPQDGGKKLVYTNKGQGFVGDKKLDPLHDVYTKLDDAEATSPMLEAYGKAFVGRWTGDITLVRDWPDIGKKGDKIVRHTTIRWIAGHKALLRQTHGGQGCDFSIIRWDPIKKQLCETDIGSGGTSYTAWISKEGDHWAWTVTGSLGDGTAMSGKGTIRFTDGNKKETVSGDVIVGGEPVSFVDEYTRADK